MRAKPNAIDLALHYAYVREHKHTKGDALRAQTALNKRKRGLAVGETQASSQIRAVQRINTTGRTCFWSIGGVVTSHQPITCRTMRAK